MNYLFKFLFIAVALVTAIPSFAVSDKEMEQAKAIAAKHYLRYANNGSDYLDKINPSSVAELTKSLKAKELENIKSFNAVAVPKDYASWDKQRLVEYWSSTFFKSPGLKEDGKKCLSVLAKNLNQINVAPASQKADAPAETPVAPANESAGSSQAAAEEQSAAPASDAEAAANLEELDEQIAAAAAQAEADAGVAEERPQKPSGTGWYVAILLVLVGVVIWLVMYASKSMKSAGEAIPEGRNDENEIREVKKAAKEEQNKMREHYASSLAAKNDEIKQLKARCSQLEKLMEGADLDRKTVNNEIESLRSELAREKSLRQESQRKLQALAQQAAAQQAAVQPVATRQPVAPERPEPKERPVAPANSDPAPRSAKPSAPTQRALPPVVYLGYVNQRGLFVKASRSLNVESSVFYMDIPDGHNGRFKVANDPEIIDRLISDPKLWLEGGCDIVNPEDADIATDIITLEEGKAYFADNSCKVVKKARIKYTF